ncbi:MAG: cation-transporting P-type ATPase, partial [Desulfoprunum sp.]|uniref:P-type ATPase n=1 Tax=Desulfoprunum sp. TaxID=2020866 RepID=UPI003C70A9C7
MSVHPPETPAFHGLPNDAVLAALDTSLSGLDSREAARRLAEYGPNQLETAHTVSALAIFAEQFKNILILILLAATVVSAFLGHAIEATAIIVITLFAVLFGFFQDYRAERAIEALRHMAAPQATVLRDNEEIDIAARDLVPGDLLVLHAGNRIAGDARLIEAIQIEAQEAALTGESVPVEKHCAPLADPDPPLAERHNMVYAGTSISRGRGRAVVVATGMRTEFGRIARMLQTVDCS